MEVVRRYVRIVAREPCKHSDERHSNKEIHEAVPILSAKISLASGNARDEKLTPPIEWNDDSNTFQFVLTNFGRLTIDMEQLRKKLLERFKYAIFPVTAIAKLWYRNWWNEIEGRKKQTQDLLQSCSLVFIYIYNSNYWVILELYSVHITCMNINA